MANNNSLILPGFGMLLDGDPLSTWFDNFMDKMNRRIERDRPKDGVSRPNYYTNEDGSELYVELPGCKKDNISVEADPETGVVVRATREIAGKKESFRISFKPDRGGIDVDAMKPKFEDGLLTIPVKEKKQEAKKLVIE